MGLILHCKHCGRIWRYTGNADNETSCPKCKSYVNLSTQRIDEPLGPTGDYSDAEYLGVSKDGLAHYWDSHYGLAAIFYPETKRLEEDRESRGMTAMEYVLRVSEAMGWRYLRPIHEIRQTDEQEKERKN